MNLDYRTAFGYLCLVVLAASCYKTLPSAPEENSLLDGPLEGLSYEQQARFLSGDEAFGEVFTSETGLGPVFVANQCASCHPGDGKGSSFVAFTRFGQPDTLGNQFLDQGGPQLQHKALPGYQPEILPMGATSMDLFAPSVTGLGFLDAVSDADLLALSDPMDADGDGISGRPHYNTIPDYSQVRPNSIERAGQYICRIGKKGAAYDLLHQSVEAYNQDMGITSLYNPIDVYTGLEIDPEVGTSTLNDVAFYLKTLKAPIQRDVDSPDVLAGAEIFNSINCAGCHTPVMQTSVSDIEQLNNVEFYPYTDLLLHDMGAGLDDGYTEGHAMTYEWRTPPLWGLGLSKDAQGGSYFLLHDGRARSIDEAIMMHGGESEQSKTDYAGLTDEDKKLLIIFLESL
jgi:CxxC motif-containing protein (DUF1111 family)